MLLSGELVIEYAIVGLLVMEYIFPRSGGLVWHTEKNISRENEKSFSRLFFCGAGYSGGYFAGCLLAAEVAILLAAVLRTTNIYLSHVMFKAE